MRLLINKKKKRVYKMESMTNKKSNNSGLKAVIVILSLLLLGNLWYVYKITNDCKAVETVLISEKDAVLKDLMIQKDSLNAAISSNTTLSDELIAERDKVQQLMADVEKSKGDVASMSKFKTEALKLRSNVAVLMKQVDHLKKENVKLTVQRDSTAVVLGESRKFADTLVNRNFKMANTIEKGSKLSVLNLEASAVRQKKSGKQISTDKASRADVLKISFMIAENQIAKSGDKTYYVQIIDTKNNILGEKNTYVSGEKSLTYSFVAAVKYENKTVKVEKDLEVKDVQSGAYFVNIFDKTELVSKTSFTLK
ncbi:Putative exported protein [Flavobacterium psychrophilum]|nr:Putative exported protein [Flavobacterium psychrophilum]